MIPTSFDKKQAQEIVEYIENDLCRLVHVYADLEKSWKLMEECDGADDLYYKFLEAASTELNGIYAGSEKIFERIIKKWDRADDFYYKCVAAASTDLNDLYTGTEIIFDRIIIFNTGQRPQGKDSHKVILKTIHEELNLTSHDTNEFLEFLCSFKHLFQHAHRVESKAAEIIDVTKQTCLKWPLIQKEIEYFLTKLKKRIGDSESQKYGLS